MQNWLFAPVAVAAAFIFEDKMMGKQMSSSSEKTTYPYGYRLSKISLLKLYMNKASVEKWSLVLGLAPFVVRYLWILFREYVFSNPGLIFLDRFVFALVFSGRVEGEFRRS